MPRSVRLARCLSILAAAAVTASAAADEPAAPVPLVLRIGVGRSNPPFSYVEDGQAAGYWVELAEATAIALGYEPRITAGIWDSIKADVAAGRLDVAASMADLPDRRLSFDFSVPVSRMTYAVWVGKDSPIGSTADLAGKRVVLQQGSATADSKALADSSASLSFVPDDADALVLLETGRYDAAVLPLAQGLYFARRLHLTEVRPLPGALLSVDQCFAVRKGNEGLVRELDAGLNVLKQSGALDAIYEKWLGVYDRSIPSPAPAWLLAVLAAAGFLLAASAVFVLALRRTVRLRTAELAENERKYRTLAESLPQMIFVKDRGLAYVSCNRLFAEALGIEPAAIAGKTDYDFYSRELADKYRADDRTVMESATSISVVETWTRGGRDTWINTVKAPMRGEDGKVAGVIGIFWDVSERLRLEEATKRSLREKEILIQEINHRVKNNLQLINAILRLELDESPGPEVERFVRDTTSRISAISTVHEMLYDSDDLTDIPVGDYLRHLARGLMSTYARPGLTVDIPVDAEGIRLDLSPMVCLGLMANEMITNSFKYAFEGKSEGRIRISLSRESGGGEFVFKYADDGIGLPAGFDRKETKSLGMVFIDSLARQLDGRLEMRGDEGLEYELRFRTAGA
jgi:PAS domain S-box-containing protein